MGVRVCVRVQVQVCSVEVVHHCIICIKLCLLLFTTFQSPACVCVCVCLCVCVCVTSQSLAGPAVEGIGRFRKIERILLAYLV